MAAVLEEFADNPFLAKFYENPQQYAFPLELFFMAERFKQLKELLQQKDMFQQITISDYLFTKCLLFAKVNLPEEEFRLYQKLFEQNEQNDYIFERYIECLLATEDFATAEASIKKQIKKVPQNSTNYVMYGKLLERQFREDDAMAQYREGIAQHRCAFGCPQLRS